MSSLIPRSSLKVPINAARKRSGSFSESVGLSRSLSTERPGTPRPVEMEPFGNVDASTCGFRKSRDFFGSVDTLSSRHQSGSFLTPLPKSSFSTRIARSFSTIHKMDSKMNEKVDIEVTKTDRTICKTLNAEEIQKMEFYSKFTPTSVTLSHFLDHSSGGGTVEDSFLFLRREIPVRLSNMMMELEELPSELLSQPACQDIISQYGQSFRDVIHFENIPNNPESHELFNQMLTEIRKRHQDTIPRMAEALHNLRDEGKLNVHSKDRLNQAIQYVLDRLYMSRISIHMLINQHTIIYGDESPVSPIHVGSIDPYCDVPRILEDAFSNAAFLCDQYYLQSPRLELEVVNAVDSAAPVQTVYVPAHLYHILFELFKNALRATVEAHEDEELPTVKVLVVKSSHDVSIKISDRGGGIPRYETKELFNYLYSTAPTPTLCTGGAGSAPLAGLGYGLPLSRLYARYFHGDIVLSSFDGYGTDATLYLRALAREASEVLPIFNQMSKQQYVRARPMVADWTDPSSNLTQHLGKGRKEQDGNTWNKKEEETL